MTTKERNAAIRSLRRIEDSAKFAKEKMAEIPSFSNASMLIANLAKIESELDYIAGELDKIN